MYFIQIISVWFICLILIIIFIYCFYLFIYFNQLVFLNFIYLFFFYQMEQLLENTISYVFYFTCVLKFSQWSLITLSHKKKIVKFKNKNNSTFTNVEKQASF